MTARKLSHSAIKKNYILIIDSACDQSIIASNVFVVLSCLGNFLHVNGASSGRMESDVALEVVDTFTKVTLNDGTFLILQMN